MDLAVPEETDQLRIAHQKIWQGLKKPANFVKCSRFTNQSLKRKFSFETQCTSNKHIYVCMFVWKSAFLSNDNSFIGGSQQLTCILQCVDTSSNFRMALEEIIQKSRWEELKQPGSGPVEDT